MKIVSVLTMREDELDTVEAVATRLRAHGFEAVVRVGAFKNAVLTTNAQPRTLREARQFPKDGNIGALMTMLAKVSA